VVLVLLMTLVTPVSGPLVFVLAASLPLLVLVHPDWLGAC
jgi:uncharacterized protein YhhL (DUF1145 family)